MKQWIWIRQYDSKREQDSLREKEIASLWTKIRLKRDTNCLKQEMANYVGCMILTEGYLHLVANYRGF